MHKIVIPKLNANDDACIMNQWAIADGAWVTAGALLAEVETSKAAMELLAEVDGLLLRDFEEGDEARVGQIIGYLFPDEASRQAFIDSRVRLETKTSDLRITHKARDLMDQHRLTEGDLATLGKTVIRESDVLTLLATRGGETDQAMISASEQTIQPPGVIELTRHQQAIARTVAASRREIPDAFLLIKINCEQPLSWLATKNAGLEAPIGLLEILVWQVGKLWSSYPLFFGSVIDEHSFLPAAAAHINVTLDQGHGLFTPVVRDADQLTLEQIADTLDEYRYQAFRGEFADSVLGQGAFSISLITEPDVVLSVPVIFPGQVCMLSLCAVLEELFLASGEVRARRVTHLGLAYDHRLINGREASAFCHALKNAVEHLGEDHVGH